MESDVAARLALGKSSEIARMFGAESKNAEPLTEDYVHGWFAWLTGQPCAWVIEVDGAFLGEIRLHEIDEHHRRAKLAVGLYDESKLGQRIGRRAIHLALGHGFGALNLHRIGLRVIADNTRAIACYRACGFLEEGREREAVLVDGARRDDVIMGLLASEFRGTP